MKAKLFGIFASLCLAIAPAFAADLKPAKGDVVLTISGEIDLTNAKDKAVFDIKMMESLPQTQFSTKTIWTEGRNTFSGVLLKDLLEAVGAKGGKLRAVAINDYAVEIPTSDAVVDGPIVATRMDGKPMSIRDKGPLWIIYPYDQDSKYRSETIYSRSIWQLSALEIME